MLPTPSQPTQSGGRGGSAGLEQRVLRRLRDLRLASGATIVVGYSGGADSLALTALLGRIARVADCRIVAVHVDHGLRIASAQAELVVELGGRLGVDVRVERLASDVVGIHPGVGVEEAARRERYLALAGVARREAASVIAVAHHQDDQAETVLLHLLRGAGVRGARGMAEATPLRVPWWETGALGDDWSGTLWRPFIGEPRSRVRGHAAGLGLPIVEDESNQEDRYRRNAIRSRVLPLLNELSPGATAALARYGTLAAADDVALDHVVERRLTAVVDDNNNLIRSAFGREPVELQRRLVRRWLDRSAVSPLPSANRVDAVVHLAGPGASGRHVELGDDMTVVVLGDRLFAGRHDDLEACVADDYRGPLFGNGADVGTLSVETPFSAAIGRFRVCAVAGVEPVESVVPATRRATFRYDGPNLRLRPPSAGDVWAVSRRKLGHWLAGQGVSSLIRDRVVCLASDVGVHWVAGLPLPAFERTDDDAAPFVTATVIEETTTCS